MILKASQRGGGKALAVHLLDADQNEHVEVHEVRGFMAESVTGAFKEAQALAGGTRCQQYLFSVSLSPPETENVRPEVFEGAIAAIETKLGLEGQPRVVVFHEKEGRRHAHAVWSRIDVETMTAKQLSFYKSKLREVSKSLYLDNGWKMPRGLMDSKDRDPRNFTLAEWQQAKRTGLNAGDLRGMVQECWAVSDSRPAFARALEERGLYLAKGDRRGHVVVTYEGDVFALSRLTDRKAREVTAKLGKPDDLRSVDDIRIINGGGKAEAQAAHIMPVAANGPDIVQNGIALCGTAHWLFDRHLISIGEDWRLLIAHNRLPEEMRAVFRSREGAIILPRDARLWPGARFLTDHRERFVNMPH